MSDIDSAKHKTRQTVRAPGTVTPAQLATLVVSVAVFIAILAVTISDGLL